MTQVPFEDFFSSLNGQDLSKFDFSKIAGVETGGTQPPKLAEVICTTENNTRNITNINNPAKPSRLNFERTENQLFPGGIRALEAKYRPTFEDAKKRFEARFFPLQNDLDVVWAGNTPMFNGGARHFFFEEHTRSRRQGEAPVDSIDTFSSEYEELRISGNTASSERVRTVLQHELGHIGFGATLPIDTAIQELPSCFADKTLSQGNEAMANQYDLGGANNFHAPKVLVGGEGWGFPEHGQLDFSDASPVAYVAWQHAWRDVFGSDDAIEKVLMASRDLALASNEQGRTVENRHYRHLPSRTQWLEAMDKIVPGSLKRFQEHPVFATPFPAGERATWTPHRKWGGCIDVLKFTPNEGFPFNPNGSVNLQTGRYEGVTGEMTMKIPSLGVIVTARHQGHGVVNPQSIASVAKPLPWKPRPEKIPMGTDIIISSTVQGKPFEVRLVWDEIAQSMVDGSKV